MRSSSSHSVILSVAKNLLLQPRFFIAFRMTRIVWASGLRARQARIYSPIELKILALSAVVLYNGCGEAPVAEMGNSENRAGSTDIGTPSDSGSLTEKTSRVLDIAIDLLDDIQKVVSAGPPKKLRIRLGERTLAELPIALTAAAAVAAGLAAVVITKLAIEVEREG